MSDREKIYADIISDVAMEVSISEIWRKRIFSLKGNDILEISFEDKTELPEYIKNDIIENKLAFTVQIVNECNEKFDDGLVIFKFCSEEYPDIISYSGNNSKAASDEQ